MASVAEGLYSLCVYNHTPFTLNFERGTVPCTSEYTATDAVSHSAFRAHTTLHAQLNSARKKLPHPGGSRMGDDKNNATERPVRYFLLNSFASTFGLVVNLKSLTTS